MRRDRHGRGLRGPLAVPGPLTRAAAPRRPPGRAAFFDAAVADAVRRIRHHCPPALTDVVVGVVDVPEITDAWADHEAPLAAAVDATAGAPARVVLYRRPLEHRAVSRQDLQNLVRRALVEQLAALTAIPISEIDPHAD